MPSFHLKADLVNSALPPFLFFLKYGALTDNTVIFNAKLQEFAQKVGFIANLYTGGKLPSEKAYYQVESLFRELQSTKGTFINDQEDQDDL